MSKFAVIDGDNVTNLIVADSKLLAEQATGKVCVEVTSTNEKHVAIGGTYVDGVFSKPKPFLNWVRDEEFGGWKPPVAPPSSVEGHAPVWDQESSSWSLVPFEE